MIGSRLGEPSFPSKTHGPDSGTGIPYADVRRAFTGFPLSYGQRVAQIADWDTTNVHRGIPSGTSLWWERFQMQEQLDSLALGHLVPACWRNKPTGTTDVFGRMWWDRPAPTIRTEFYKPEKGRYLHPEEDRPITVREAARLQSFPDAFVFPEHQSMVSVARQIGNAVPPRLAQALAVSVLEHVRNASPPNEMFTTTACPRERQSA